MQDPAHEQLSTGPPPESKLCQALVLTLGFLMSVIWIQLVATELVVILEFVGNLANIDASVLGMTVLAWGALSAPVTPHMQQRLHTVQ